MMEPWEQERIERLEYLVVRLYQRLGVDPNADLPAPFKPLLGGLAVLAGGSAAPADAVIADAVVSDAVPPASAPAGPADYLPPDFHEALRRGRTLDAIKIYRQVTGASLDEAKRVVQALAAQQR